jgi:hypothetical protein
MHAPLYRKPRHTVNGTKYSLFHHDERLPFSVVPDVIWPGMYRVEWPDGQLSDMGNLCRCQYAGVRAARYRFGYHNLSRLRWEKQPGQNATSGPLVRGPENSDPDQGGAP